MPIKTISAAQFATAFDLRPNLVAWFLGAGASAASGIPTGYAMNRDFKAQIFCRETNLSKREIDTADPIWIDRIDAFFRQNSLCHLTVILQNMPWPSKRSIQRLGIADSI